MFAEYCFACRHVLEQARPVLYVVRDGDDWTFVCGSGDHGGIEDWGRSHTRHLLEVDASLNKLAGMGARQQSARYNVRSPWLLLPEFSRLSIDLGRQRGHEQGGERLGLVGSPSDSPLSVVTVRPTSTSAGPRPRTWR